MRIYKGNSTVKTDVTLKLGDCKMPVHQAVLAESTDFFKAMFEASSASKRMLLHCTSWRMKLIKPSGYTSISCRKPIAARPV